MDEQPTLNPLHLLLRSFRWKGRFLRGEFALALLTAVATSSAFALGAAVMATLSGADEASVNLIFEVMAGPVFLVVAFGAALRRLHDLGRPSWWVVFGCVPCVNFALILYLLFTPGSGSGQSHDSAAAKVVVAVAFAFLMMAIIVRPFAVPWLLQKRIEANESAAIERLRRFVAAQAEYAKANGGYYEGRWECLATPAECIPGYSGPAFMSRKDTQRQMSGYRWNGASPRVDQGDGFPPGVSSSSTDGFVVFAAPSSPGQTAVRFLCADASGTICASQHGPIEGLVEELDEAPWLRCADTCTPIG